jgi:hypothetical protein
MGIESGLFVIIPHSGTEIPKELDADNFKKNAIKQIDKEIDIFTDKLYDFKDVFKNKDIIYDLLINYKKYNLPNSHSPAPDLILSLLITLNNGTIGPYEGHYDCDYYNNNIIVQHQYKRWYNTDMPDDLKYLVNTE